MHYRTLPQHVLDALTAHTAVVSGDGEIVSVNRPWRRFADENNLGRNGYCIGDNYHAACEGAGADDPVANGVSAAIRGVCSGELLRAEFEYPCHSPDERRWFVVRISRFDVGGKRHALVMHQNATSLKSAEEDLGRIADGLSSRLERLNLLSGSVAHEFNNILTALGAHIDEAARLSGAGRSPASSHAQLRELSRQARILTASLHDITRGRESVRKPLRLADAARGAMAAIGPVLPSETTVTLDADERVRVLGDSDQLQRALLNLALNASNAMAPGGGRIVIGIKRVGDDAFMSVADTGSGLSDEVRDRMFDPYFTTREGAGGTGLGLSVVKDIAREHGGRVSVQSEPGAGTTMTIVIPAIGAGRGDDTGEDSGREKSTTEVPPQARAAVVIEDNPDVLGVVAGMLATMGYAVVERDGVVTNGAAPETVPPNTALVVADLDLPGGDGATLLEGMRSAGYDGPAVLMSGSRVQGMSSDPSLGAALLAKPFGEAELRSAVEIASGLCAEQ